MTYARSSVATRPRPDGEPGPADRNHGSSWYTCTVADRRFEAPGISTPALVVDLSALEHNLYSMARHAAANGIALRPHADVHNAPAVAALQLAAGATGLSVATLGQAELFAASGVSDLFIAYPLWAEDDLATRLRELARRVQLAVGTDSVDGVERLRRAVPHAPDLRVLVEVDCGLRRSGVEPADAATLAWAARDAGFAVGGVFTYPGHGYGPGMRDEAAEDEVWALSEAAEGFETAGIECPVRSGGSTPTARVTTGAVVNELRPGSYAFNDAEQVALGICTLDEVALGAVATVVSAPAPGRVVLDAGAKVLGPDRPPWTPGYGLLPELPAARVTGLWEHHAVVDVSGVDRRTRPRLGDRVTVVPNHVGTAVNLARELHVVEGGEVVECWEIAAAGRNR